MIRVTRDGKMLHISTPSGGISIHENVSRHAKEPFEFLVLYELADYLEKQTAAALVVDPSRLGAAMKAFDAAGGSSVSYAPAWMRKALEAASTPAAPVDGWDAAHVKPNCKPPSWMFPEDEVEPAASEADWRVKAAAWLEEQAVEQENTNKAYPAHVAAYPSWADRVHWIRTLASKVSESQATSAEVGECNCPNGRAECMPDCASRKPTSHGAGVSE